jgi:filamentous hemagglutinin family protein
MRNGNRATARLRIKLVSAAVASCFASTVSLANPTGPTVVNGTATIVPLGNTLQITNSPNSIINWQSFSIGASEITRFLQQSNSSAVLNRVVTQNPSAILGALQSNGRVFLINPNGILFGAGAQVDVAGLVASTLNLSDTDFLAGRLRFTEVPGAGSIVNQGAINAASGGHVYLVGPAVTNSGIITSPKGEVILAAGNTVELVEPGTPNLRVQITAPDNQAINLGQIIADSGRVGIYAGLINQSGTIRANSAVATEDGRIVLKATKGVTLEAGSVTQASGPQGGSISLETETGTIRVAGQLDATGSEAGGAINIGVTGATGGIDLGSGLNAGNASVNVSGPGQTTTLNADIITAGAAITINDSVILGVPATITLDTTNGGAVPGGANVTITGTVNDDIAGTSGLVLRASTGGANTLGGAVGNTTPIASLMTSGNTTAINGGLVNTTGNQTYNGPVTLGTATTLAASAPTANIAINNSLSAGANSLTINSGNNLVIAGNVFSGPQTVNAGGGLIVQGSATGPAQLSATGGQTINARFIDVTAQNNNFAGVSNNVSGNQVITVAGGGTSPGIDVQSLASGGSASMGNNAPGAIQTITVTDADHINVNGFGSNITNVSAIIHATPGTQAISITGSGSNAINIGSAGALGGSVINARGQSITAGASGQSGSITMIGPAVNTRSALITSNSGFPGNSQTLSTSGTLSVTGGSAPAQVPNNPSGVFHNSTGPQTIAAANIAIQGGTAGTGNSALISVPGGGNQQINVSGDITLTGGTTGSNNFARLSASGGQNIAASGVTLTGGGGDGNSAEISQFGLGSSQALTVTGGGTLALQGGGGTNNFARIRNEGLGQQIDFPSAGSLTLTGGSGASSDFAQIRANASTQTISGSPAITLTGGTGGALDLGNNAQISTAVGAQTITAGNTTLTAGGVGFNNTATFLSPLQTITVHGDLTLTGGSSTSSLVRGGEARIGGSGVSPGATPTHLTLTVDHDVTLTGGSVANAGAVIGSSPLGTAQATDITMNVGRNVTLNPGTAALAGSRIGSPSAAIAGGTIIVHAGTSGTGDIVLNSTSPSLASFIRTLDGVTLQANAITEGANAVIQAGSLTANTANGASLVSSGNSVSNFAATNTTSGNITLNNASSLLTVTGVNQTPSGALTINQTGDLTLTGGVFSGPQSISATGNISVVPSSPAVVNAFGPQTITAGGGLIVQSSSSGSAQITAIGGQTIDAGFIEVTAQGGNSAFITNFGSGNQVLTTHGANTQGEGIAVRNLGGGVSLALIDQQASAGAQQLITANNADHVRVIGGSGPAQISTVPGATQTVLIRGAGLNALEVGGASAISSSSISGGNQAITAGLPLQHGSITIQGNAAGGSNAVIASLLVPGGTQSVSTSGLLTVLGGSALVGSTAGIFANGIGGQQTISANAIALQGGSTGSGNRSQIGANNGSQQTNVGAGGIAITGGSGGSNNDAQIRQVVPSGSQMITVNGGDVTLLGGTGGTNNAAFILGSNQGLTVTTGNVFLTGGAGTGNSSIIGSLSGVATNLALSAGGDVVLTGGSATGTGANIGSTGAAPLQPTNIAINAGGDVILNAGTGTGVRIGSSVNAPAAGGDILISADGDIQLNGTTQAATIRTLGNVTLHADTPGGTISENANGLIQANALTTTSNAGTSLTGPNQVAALKATNAAAGDITFNNSGNLAVMASNVAPGGKITVNNSSGDLSTSGPIAALGGGSADVALTAGGAVNISHPVTATGTGDVALAGGAVTVGDTSVVAGGAVTVNAASLDVKGVSSGALIQAGDGFNANLSGDLRVRSASVGGGLGGWATILSSHGPVNISAGSVALEGGKNLAGFAAITGGPVAVTTTGDFSIAGGSGLGSFGMLLSNQNIDFTVGGSLRLKSGTGFGSFARIQILYPGTTISVHFPNLASGGYFVNGVEGRISQGLTGFFTGVSPARLGKTLITTYGE